MKNNRIIDTCCKWYNHSYIIILLIACLNIPYAKAEDKRTIQSQIINTNGIPVEGARVNVVLPEETISAVTDSTGRFSLEVPDGVKGTVEFTSEGYYTIQKPFMKDFPEKITLLSIGSLKYNGTFVLDNEVNTRETKSISTAAVEKKNFKKALSLDNAIQDEVPGLLIVGKSGMPNEGAYMNLRGIHSFIASNSPLIVLNGIPYFGYDEVSRTINGYSRGIFSAINVNDIRNVTVLKGADAAAYGSLGSNGVVMIETEQATSDNLNTRISFTGQYGMSIPSRDIPVLGVADYKNYLQDIGMTRYNSLTALRTDYPFLENTDNYHSYLFNNNTDWQSEIKSPAFTTDNVFRVEGGDEIAKYNISFGYTSEGGVLGKTNSDRYSTLINANILVSRQIDIFANAGLSYRKSNLQEQGMNTETNAILAASLMMPMLSPYQKEPDGNLLSRYATYNGWNVNDNPTFAYDNVSNPLAIVNTLEAADKIYDANIRFGLNYRANRYLTLTGLLNIYYNYTEETVFIPGVTDQAITPQYYGAGINTVRRGIVENRTYFYQFNTAYQRTFNAIHDIKASAGIRYLGRNVSVDCASGYNTANDFYQSLDKTTIMQKIEGDNIEWKWLNYYLQADYIYNKILKANFNMAVDGTSVSGIDAPRFGVFPSLGVSYLLGNTGILPEAISLLNLSAEVSHTGNSRFSSNYAKNYYQNSNLFEQGTITRMNVPNTRLEWEKNNQLEFGLDLSLFNYLIDIQANVFNSRAYDLLVQRNISKVYGSDEYYDNTGEIATNGMEIALRLNPVRTKNIEWSIGVAISSAKSKIIALGNSDELTINFKDYNNDDAVIIMKKGESPYQFYGYRTNGVYSTTQEAQASGLTNIYGNPFQGGDVKFVNVDKDDQTINAKDKVLLGSAIPDFFGNLYTSFRYKKITLLADFGYSVGNKAYNAVRRELESMDKFYNQSISVKNRWQIEGQQNAALPRAMYNDPAGNNVFSDRWIEDASYIKLRNLMLRYDFGQALGIFRSGSVYVTGENLFTITNYLGGDPEFSYSYSSYMQGFDYAKVTRPKTVQIGFQLNF